MADPIDSEERPEGELEQDSLQDETPWIDDLSQEKLDKLEACTDDAKKVYLLADIMGMTYPGHPSNQNAIIVEFSFLNIMFALEEGFTADQCAAFYTLMKGVFQQSIQNASLSKEESFELFKATVFEHSAPPKTLFTLQIVEKIAHFVSTSFYRHYSAYQLCFDRPATVIEAERLLQVETPMLPELLEMAATSDKEEMIEKEEQDQEKEGGTLAQVGSDTAEPLTAQ